MWFGWKPEADKEIPPIPLCFGLISYDLDQFNYRRIAYIGPRYSNSYKLHEQFANKTYPFQVTKDNSIGNFQSYSFQFPKQYDSNNFKYEEAFQ